MRNFADPQSTGDVRLRPARPENRDFFFAVRRAAFKPYVDEAKGRGIGSALVRDVMQAAGYRGVPVRLSVLVNNPARRLYECLGFRVTRIEHARVKMEWLRDQRQD